MEDEEKPSFAMAGNRWFTLYKGEHYCTPACPDGLTQWYRKGEDGGLVYISPGHAIPQELATALARHKNRLLWESSPFHEANGNVEETP